ncbi:MAG: hypothetical protein L6R41_004420 [Letrouitia leprolyta]|nr:MAG: hypothetical protein L6R41_004420 [Letrouitia leprolyta]
MVSLPADANANEQAIPALSAYDEPVVSVLQPATSAAAYATPASTAVESLFVLFSTLSPRYTLSCVIKRLAQCSSLSHKKPVEPSTDTSHTAATIAAPNALLSSITLVFILRRLFSSQKSAKTTETTCSPIAKRSGRTTPEDNTNRQL